MPASPSTPLPFERRGPDGGDTAGTTERVRLVVALLIGACAATAAAFVTVWQLTVLIGWDVVAVVMTGWIWARIRSLDAAATRVRTRREDDSRDSTRLLLSSAAVVSLVGVAFAMVDAKSQSGALAAVLTVGGVVTVVLSWALVHTLYTVRYARLYYETPTHGIDFNSDEDPDFLDFAYFAFTIGMTCQVSDTNIGSRPIRRAVLSHALLSYLFAAVIVALTINVIAGLVH